MNERDITTRDGRTLRVREDGAADGVPVLSLHGTPGCGLLDPGDVARAQRRGIRLIGYDRPGYGGSDRHAGRNVADCAGDVRSIAAALGIDRLAVWGISGGGPHAAACAALLDGLVPAVAVLGSIAPYGAPKLDYFAGMGKSNVDDIKLELSDPAAARAKAADERRAMLEADVAGLLAAWESIVSPVDAGVLTDEFGAHVLSVTQTGLAPGPEGWNDDGDAHLGDWGFGLTQIQTPVLIMHGVEDRFVPVAHGRWLGEAIPTAETRIYDDEGHLSLLVNRMDEMYDWLLERM